MNSMVNLRATGDVSPFRFVKNDTGDNSGAQSGDNEESVGVSQGDNREFDSDLHAISGDQIRLQPESLVRVECGGAVAPGGGVKSDADGKAVAIATTGTTNEQQNGIAQETGADTEIIFIKWEPKV
ncbi:unnamed protein product, partial [marine sediment metagenome]